MRRHHACPEAFFVAHRRVSLGVLGLQRHPQSAADATARVLWGHMKDVGARTSPPGTNVSTSAPDSARHMMVMPTRRSPARLVPALAAARAGDALRVLLRVATILSCASDRVCARW